MKSGNKVFEYAIEALQHTQSIVKTREFTEVVDVLSTHRIWASGMGKVYKLYW